MMTNMKRIVGATMVIPSASAAHGLLFHEHRRGRLHPRGRRARRQHHVRWELAQLHAGLDAWQHAGHQLLVLSAGKHLLFYVELGRAAGPRLHHRSSCDPGSHHGVRRARHLCAPRGQRQSGGPGTARVGPDRFHAEPDRRAWNEPHIVSVPEVFETANPTGNYAFTLRLNAPLGSEHPGQGGADRPRACAERRRTTISPCFPASRSMAAAPAGTMNTSLPASTFTLPAAIGDSRLQQARATALGRTLFRRCRRGRWWCWRSCSRAWRWPEGAGWLDSGALSTSHWFGVLLFALVGRWSRRADSTGSSAIASADRAAIARANTWRSARVG